MTWHPVVAGGLWVRTGHDGLAAVPSQLHLLGFAVVINDAGLVFARGDRIPVLLRHAVDDLHPAIAA